MDYGILVWVFKIGCGFVVVYLMMHSFLQLIKIAVKMAVMEAVLDIYRILIEQQEAKLRKMRKRKRRKTKKK